LDRFDHYRRRNVFLIKFGIQTPSGARDTFLMDLLNKELCGYKGAREWTFSIFQKKTFWDLPTTFADFLDHLYMFSILVHTELKTNKKVHIKVVPKNMFPCLPSSLAVFCHTLRCVNFQKIKIVRDRGKSVSKNGPKSGTHFLNMPIQ